MEGEVLRIIIIVLGLTITSAVLFIRHKLIAKREAGKMARLSERIARGESVIDDLPEFSTIIKKADSVLEHFDLFQFKRILGTDVKIETPGRTFLIVASIMPESSRLVLIVSTTVNENFHTGIVQAGQYEQRKFVFIELRHDKQTGVYVFRGTDSRSIEERSLARDTAFVIEEHLMNEMQLHE